MRRPWLKLGLAALALFVAILAIVPLFVNGAALKPAVESKLTAALGRKVTIGSLSFSLLSGSLVARDISIADDPAFSTSAFIRAGELKVGVKVMPLLFHHQVDITGLVIDHPDIQLVQNQAGKWNFSSIGGASQSNPSQPIVRPDLTVGELQIKDGSASVASVPPRAHPFVYSNVNLTVKQFSFTTSFPFDLAATLPAKGSLKLTGTAGPIPLNAEQTPFQAKLTVLAFDPVASGLIDASAGIAGVLDVDAQTTSDGTTVTSTGKINAERLQLVRTGSGSSQPVNIDYSISHNLQSRAGQVSDIVIHAGPAAAHVTGHYQITSTAVMLDLHLAAPSMPVDPLEKLLPAAGIKVPAGSQLRGGTLSANLNVTGAATEATITGPVEIDNTSLAGFDLGSKIEGLNPFGSHSGGTEIKTIRANLNSTPHITTVSAIEADLPQFGAATGSGTVSPSGALNFNLVATLSSSNLATALGSLATRAVGQVRGLVGGLLHRGQAASTRASQGIPLTITGTATSPRIRANLGALLR